MSFQAKKQKQKNTVHVALFIFSGTLFCFLCHDVHVGSVSLTLICLLYPGSVRNRFPCLLQGVHVAFAVQVKRHDWPMTQIWKRPGCVWARQQKTSFLYYCEPLCGNS